MRKPLIIKTGTTLPELLASKGDFEDWILAGMGLSREQVTIVDVEKGEPLPDFQTVAGVVITGSHAMVTDHHAWSERTAVWLRSAVEQHIPTLGICYGHQLLAYALGGEVDDNLSGAEAGSVEVRLTENGHQDRLLGELGNPIIVQLSHIQSVSRLPPSAKLLASSALDPHLAFAAHGCAWGIQFHPEFDAEITRAYIRYDAPWLQKAGRDPVILSNQCTETPLGALILRRFASMTKHRNSGQSR